MFILYARSSASQKATIICEDTVKEIVDYVAACNQTGREWDLEPCWISCELYGGSLDPNTEKDIAKKKGITAEFLNAL